MNLNTSMTNVFDSLNEWVAFIEPEDQKILWANQTFLHEFSHCQNIYDKRFSNIIQKKFLIIGGNDPLEKSIQTGQNCQADFILVEPQGRPRALEVSTSPLKNKAGLIENITWICRDISNRIKTDEKIRFLAFHDPLTGLYNRNMFCDRLQHTLAYAKREKQMAALIYLDLDHFKRINDHLGHSYGDLLLKSVANRLHSCVRENDTVARIGGDEFVVLISCHNRDEIDVVAQKIMMCFMNPFLLEDKKMTISGSIGIAVYPDDADTDSTLLSYADMAMYAAKISGQHCCRYFSKEIASLAENRRGLFANLKTCVEQINTP